MNFVSLKDQVGKSNTLMRSMLAMINQEIDLNTRSQIISHLSSLVNKIENDNMISELIKEL